MPSFAPELLDLALTHVVDVITLLDSEQRIVYANRSRVGSAIEDLIGRRLDEFVPAGDRHRLLEALERARTTGAQQRYEVVAEGPGGRFVFDSRVAYITDPDGTARGWVLSSTDITDRAALVRDFELFFDITDELLAILTEDGIFERVNPSFHLLHPKPEQLLGTSVWSIIHPDDHPKVAEAMKQVRARAEFRTTSLQNGERILEGWFSRASDGRVFGAARDVTDERVLQQRAMASQKLEAVGQLAGGVAHDFNNLLLSVLLNTEEALGALPEGHVAAEHLEDIRQAAQLSADLTKQLLAFSRRTHRPRDVDVNEITSRMIAVLRRTIPENVDIDLIPGHKLGWVHADTGQVEQILLNLALNARDAMPEGGRLTISTQNVLINGEYRKNHPWARPGRYVLLTVADTGTGIPDDVIERIFEPFFSTKGVGYGTGLGLTIVQDVVARHEGMLHVYSEAGQGTMFKIYLPVSVVDASEVSRAPVGRVPGGTEMVLVAEDEPFVQRVLERLLKRAGYDVVLVGDGRDVLEQLDSGLEPDLIMLDVVMPMMSGPRTIEALRARGKHPPVIMASGYSDAVLAPESLATVPLIEKPFEPDALLRLIREQLDAAKGD